jgi:SAM-dependent methyltransferase
VYGCQPTASPHAAANLGQNVSSRRLAVRPEPERSAVAVTIAGDIPKVLLPRQTFFGSFRVLNRGSEPLSSSTSNGYALAYRWLDTDGDTFVEGPRSTLPHDLPSDETVELRVVLLAPDSVGTHELRVTLVQEGIAWLDDLDVTNALVAQVDVRDDDADSAFATRFAQRFPRPDRPYGSEYAQVRRSMIEFIGDEGLADLREDGDLAPGYGIGIDERVVEYPWLLAQQLGGRLLDAGSTLNHREIVDRLLPRVTELHVLTLQPEEEAFWQQRISYVFGDLRELPYRDGWFDRAACISTLEHVGMDNSTYGDTAPRSDAPEAEQLVALRELWRVVRPGGHIFLTVPYGMFRDHGWELTLDRNRVNRLLTEVGADERSVDVFQYSADGWKRSSLDRASAARTRDSHSEPVGDDLAVAARAVACLRLPRL